MAALIPKVFHRAWFGGPLPGELALYGDTWEQLHPGWVMRFWTEETLNVDALFNGRLFRAAERLVSPDAVGQLRADIVRYELLYGQGGVWIDCDFACQRPIDELVDGVSAFAAWETQNEWIGNAILGAEPEHPFLYRLIEGLETSIVRNRGSRPAVMSGPQYLTKLWRKKPDGLAVFPQRFFYPYRYDELERGDEEFPDAYGTHHWFHKRTLAGAPL